MRPGEGPSCLLNSTDRDTRHEDEVKSRDPLPQQRRPVDECLAIFKDPRVSQHLHTHLTWTTHSVMWSTSHLCFSPEGTSIPEQRWGHGSGGVQKHSGIPFGVSDGESRERCGHTQGDALQQTAQPACPGKSALQRLRLLQGSDPQSAVRSSTCVDQRLIWTLSTLRWPALTVRMWLATCLCRWVWPDPCYWMGKNSTSPWQPLKDV